MNKLPEQLDLFKSNLRDIPFCTNDFAEGLYNRRVDEAIKRKYIQHNQVNEMLWMVFDIDRSITPMDIEEELLLPPCNLFVQNPENGHAHVAYSFLYPVHKNPSSSQKAIRYAAAIEHAYMERLGADKGYSGFIMKNPLHEHWNVSQQHLYSYDLWDLARFVDLKKYNDRRIKLDYGLGRNVTCFHRARFWSYPKVYLYRPHRQDEWNKAVYDYCEQVNSHFESSLPYCEIKAIAKSISKWVWNNYNQEVKRGRDKLQNFNLELDDKLILSAKNTHRARKEATQSQIKDAVKVLQAQGKKVTQKAIAEISGISTRTIRRHKDLLL